MANHTRAETLTRVMREAATSRYKTLPPLPTIQELTKSLRTVNDALEDGGCELWLYCQGAGWPDARWIVDSQPGGGGDNGWPGSPHFEWVPGNGSSFDASAAARRLLAEARLAGFR